MVDGSNESLYHANEEFDPNLCTGVPLQKSFENVDVLYLLIHRTCYKILLGLDRSWLNKLIPNFECGNVY